MSGHIVTVSLIPRHAQQSGPGGQVCWPHSPFSGVCHRAITGSFCLQRLAQPSQDVAPHPEKATTGFSVKTSEWFLMLLPAWAAAMVSAEISQHGFWFPGPHRWQELRFRVPRQRRPKAPAHPSCPHLVQMHLPPLPGSQSIRSFSTLA